MSPLSHGLCLMETVSDMDHKIEDLLERIVCLPGVKHLMLATFDGAFFLDVVDWTEIRNSETELFIAALERGLRGKGALTIRQCIPDLAPVLRFVVLGDGTWHPQRPSPEMLALIPEPGIEYALLEPATKPS